MTLDTSLTKVASLLKERKELSEELIALRAEAAVMRDCLKEAIKELEGFKSLTGKDHGLKRLTSALSGGAP